MALRTTLGRVLLGSLALASTICAHAVDIGQLQPRHDTETTCDPTKTVTDIRTETTTVTSTKALLTITLGGGTTTKTETQTYTVTDTETETVTKSETCIPSTTTAVPTPSSCPTNCPAPPSCNNLGFDWAYYNNTARNSDTTYSTFRPVSFKKTQPLHVGTTSYVGGLYGQGANTNGPIYNSGVSFKQDYFALNHHAYLYACEGGTYRITVPYANDAVDLWTGAKAYSGWTDTNADAKARYNQPDHIAGSAVFNLQIPANTYIPIRFFYGQAQYGGGFTFNITTPSGETIVSNEATFSPYVVRYSCDGTTAPKFPAFGNES